MTSQTTEPKPTARPLPKPRRTLPPEDLVETGFRDAVWLCGVGHGCVCGGEDCGSGEGEAR